MMNRFDQNKKFTKQNSIVRRVSKMPEIKNPYVKKNYEKLGPFIWNPEDLPSGVKDVVDKGPCEIS